MGAKQGVTPILVTLDPTIPESTSRFDRPVARPVVHRRSLPVLSSNNGATAAVSSTACSLGETPTR